MPIIWIIAIVAGGLVVYEIAAAATQPKKSPNTVYWPAGVTPASAKQAVDWALAHETSAPKLRVFAGQLAIYDKASTQKLYDRAIAIDVANKKSVSAFDPGFIGKFGPISNIRRSL